MVSSLAYTYSLKEGMHATKTLFSVCGGSSFSPQLFKGPYALSQTEVPE